MHCPCRPRARVFWQLKKSECLSVRCRIQSRSSATVTSCKLLIFVIFKLQLVNQFVTDKNSVAYMKVLNSRSFSYVLLRVNQVSLQPSPVASARVRDIWRFGGRIPAPSARSPGKFACVSVENPDEHRLISLLTSFSSVQNSINANL